MRLGKRAFGFACVMTVVMVSLPGEPLQAVPPSTPEAKQESPTPAPSTPAPEAKKGARDFDFFLGEWKTHNRRLNRRSHEWEEFEATSSVKPILGGLGNFDEFKAVFHGRPLEGITLRLFDPATGEWSLYWADNRQGVLQSPMVGHFDADGRGEFFDEEEVGGKKIKVRFRWTHKDRPHWEQALSHDGGKTWETDWVMDMTRVK